MTTPDAAVPEKSEISMGFVAGLCYVGALALVGVGFYTMFTYQSWGTEGPGRFVGGDAYNYLIIATRGVGWMVAAVVAAILGLGAQLANKGS